MIATSSQVRSTERRDGVSIAEVVIDDMAIGNPVSPAARLAPFGPHPRHPYSAVPLPSNWELWRNFPDATQQWYRCQPGGHGLVPGNHSLNCPLATRTI